MTTRKIRLHIEQLRLHGFAPEDRLRIGVALERELTALLAQNEEPTRLASSRTIPALPKAVANTPPGATPDIVGAAVARAVYGGFTR